MPTPEPFGSSRKRSILQDSARKGKKQREESKKPSVPSSPSPSLLLNSQTTHTNMCTSGPTTPGGEIICETQPSPLCSLDINTDHECALEPHIHARMRAKYFFHCTSEYNHLKPDKSVLLFLPHQIERDIHMCANDLEFSSCASSRNKGSSSHSLTPSPQHTPSHHPAHRLTPNFQHKRYNLPLL